MTLTCRRCGGDLVPGVPGDVYCPKDECFIADRKDVMKFIIQNKERDERAELVRLKEKYDNE